MGASQLTTNKNAERKCKITSCERKSRSLGLCDSHYARKRKSIPLNGPINEHKHGLRKSSEYSSWSAMRNRCLNPKGNEFHNYGGRGIKVSKRWDDFLTFLKDMGPKPGKDFSIERRNNNKGYFPSNCYWGTPLEQSRNRNSNVLNLEKAREIRKLYSTGDYSQYVLGKLFGVSRDVIGHVVRGNTWKE